MLHGIVGVATSLAIELSRCMVMVFVSSQVLISAIRPISGTLECRLRMRPLLFRYVYLPLANKTSSVEVRLLAACE